jgi:molybdopterin-guanine dinucleotide biosynthesis protein A
MGGSPKALLPFGRRPLIEHIAETLRSVLPDCLVVTNAPELYASPGLRMVGDVCPEGGSLVNLDTPEDLAHARALGDRRPAGPGRAASGPIPDGDKAGA